MLQFKREYPGLFEIPQLPVAELPETSLPDKIRPRREAKYVPMVRDNRALDQRIGEQHCL